VLIKTITKNFELIFWLTALVSLAFFNPAGQSHFSFCIFKLMGISWCPGCGIGHAISWLLHGHLAASFKAQWLGIPALIIIIYRIFKLSMQQMLTFKQLKLNNNGI